MKKGLITAMIGAAVYAVGAAFLPWQSFQLAKLEPTSLALHPLAWVFVALAALAAAAALWGLATRRHVVAGRAALLGGLALAAWMVVAQADRTWGLHLMMHEAVTMDLGFVVALCGTLLVFGGGATTLALAPRWDEATPVLRVRATPAAGLAAARDLVIYEPRVLALARELGFAAGSAEAEALARLGSAALTREGEVVLGLADARVRVAVDGLGGRTRRGDGVRLAHGDRAAMDLGALELRFDFVRQERHAVRPLVRGTEALALALATLLVFLAAGVATVLDLDKEARRVLPDEDRRAATVAALTEEDRKAEDPVTIDTAMVEVRDVAKAAGGVEGRFGDPDASPAKPMKVPPRNGRMVERIDPKHIGLLETVNDPKIADALADIISPDGSFAASLAVMTNGKDESWSLGQGTKSLSIKGDGDGGPGDGVGRLLGIGPLDTGPGPGVVVALAPRSARKVPKVELGPGAVGGSYCKRADIESAVRRRAGAIRSCYEQRLQVNESLRGTVAVHWTIGLDGKVMAADAAKDTLGDGATTQCVLRAVRGMRFPEPDGGICVVSWPFVFNPG
ncbi:MAG: AgmX/PglI C-terminal domain-containing protein [Myxococcota bacterium]